ncbi:hypothetical protein [Streptomyces sp. PTD9-10]|uniref:hypothetical protein n=1 Tax=Streptomyces sp. PTD9-10 TaxID=3120151 RepID=UPI0030096EBA
MGAALRRVQDRQTRAFWEHDLPSLSPRERSIPTEPFLNRLGRLLSDDLMRRLLCNPGPPLDVRLLIRERRSLMIKLPVDNDVIGEAASLVGVALFSLIYAATFDERDKDWRDTYTLIVDEFQNFVTSEFVKLFVGGRKYGAKLVLAHQYMNQLDQPGLDVNRRGILTARNVVAFHVTPHDATEVAPLFAQLEKKLNRPHLVADVASALEHHPAEVVKRFALRHVQPLIQGSRLGGRGSLDFGWGDRHFAVSDVRRALVLLNELLYEAERDGRENPGKQRGFLEAMQETSCFPYGEDARNSALTGLEADLSSVVDALIDEPILERQIPGSEAGVETLLPVLPLGQLSSRPASGRIRWRPTPCLPRWVALFRGSVWPTFLSGPIASTAQPALMSMSALLIVHADSPPSMEQEGSSHPDNRQNHRAKPSHQLLGDRLARNELPTPLTALLRPEPGVLRPRLRSAVSRGGSGR